MSIEKIGVQIRHMMVFARKVWPSGHLMFFCQFGSRRSPSLLLEYILLQVDMYLWGERGTILQEVLMSLEVRHRLPVVGPLAKDWWCTKYGQLQNALYTCLSLQASLSPSSSARTGLRRPLSLH